MSGGSGEAEKDEHTGDDDVRVPKETLRVARGRSTVSKTSCREQRTGTCSD